SSASAISNTGASFGNAYATAKKILTAKNYGHYATPNTNSDKQIKEQPCGQGPFLKNNLNGTSIGV
ncbi:MAG: hypothetical protein VW868_01700, partial [Bacteroidota bacterium]